MDSAAAISSASGPKPCKWRMAPESACWKPTPPAVSHALPRPSRTLPHYVFARRWTEAVALFRNHPLLPDFLADGPPHDDGGGLAAPPWLLAIRNATARARLIAPARPEIEFLHAWAAFHLDPDTATMGPYELGIGRAGLVDTDDAYLLDALDRAVVLPPDDPLFAEARRIVANRAHVTYPDAMRRTFLLFDGVGESCAGPGCAEPDPRAERPAPPRRPWSWPSGWRNETCIAPRGRRPPRRP